LFFQKEEPRKSAGEAFPKSPAAFDRATGFDPFKLPDS